jgi:hypothetical protein
MDSTGDFHQHQSMISKALLWATVAVPLALAWTGCQHQDSNQPTAVAESGDWEAELAKFRGSATFYARQVKERFPTSDPARALLERQYVAAETAVNLWILDVQDSLRAGRKPASSAVYAQRERSANEAFARFVSSAETALDLDHKPKFLPLATMAPGLIELVWKKLLEAEARHSQEAAKTRNDYAARMDSYKLPSFNKAD